MNQIKIISSVLFGILFLSGCATIPLQDNIIGTWKSEHGAIWTFYPDGTSVYSTPEFNSRYGRIEATRTVYIYTISGRLLTIVKEDGNGTMPYEVKIKRDVLHTTFLGVVGTWTRQRREV